MTGLVVAVVRHPWQLADITGGACGPGDRALLAAADAARLAEAGAVTILDTIGER
jgi:hypothetical protein